MKNNFKKQIFIDNVQMDTQTSFIANGDINIYPCSWEDEKEVTNGKRVRYKAGIEVDADGRTRVKRYNIGMNGRKHDVLFETTHGCVKITRPQYHPSDKGRRRKYQEFVYVTFKFPKNYGAALTRTYFDEETDIIKSVFKTRKEETVWK